MRTLVIGDIHGGFRGLKQVVERAKITTQDKLIFLGDYVDGWSESAHVISYLLELSETNNCIFIRGNHDLWCGQWLNKGASNLTWEMHGGRETINSYIKTGNIVNTAHKKFFEDLKSYYVDYQNRVFLHAGFTSKKGIGNEEDETTYYFDRSLWNKALTAHKKVLKNRKPLPRRLSHNTEIFIGHTPTLNFSKEVPMNACNVWNVDTGAAFTGKLTVMDVDTKEFWQSDPLKELYPDEKGRN